MAAVDNRFNRNPFQHTVELSGPGGLIGVFLKESGFGPVVLLKLSDEDDLAEILLGEVLTIEVKVEIALQGGFQVASGGEGGGFQHLGDAVVFNTSATRSLKCSIMPLVCGCLGLTGRYWMPCTAQG